MIGNVPFGAVRLHDPAHNGGGHSLHNHFIIKSLGLVKPGGLVAVLTSRYTMDAQNPAAREEMWQEADLVGAVRLPSGAHRRAAGTEAVTDLLVFRRLDDLSAGRESVDREPPEWVTRGQGPNKQNMYFDQNPHLVLGDVSLGRGMYGNDEVIVSATGPLEPALRRALDQVVDKAQHSGLTASAEPAGSLLGEPAAVVRGEAARFIGHITAESDGSFTRLGASGAMDPLPVPGSQAAELRALLSLRDRTVSLLEAEAADRTDTPAIATLRGSLNREYDQYAARYGPVNRYTLRRIAPDKTTGAERHAQYSPPVLRIFDKDPHAATVRALEIFDGQTQTAIKASIMHQRVIAPRQPRLGADNPHDALAICMDTVGRVDLERIARLLGTEPDQAREALADLVYDDPTAGRLVPAAEYLSGNVRVKLEQAAEAAATDERFRPNLTALRAVLPPDLGPAEIDARMGAAWLGAEDVQAFLREVLDDSSIEVRHGAGADWKVNGGRRGVLSTSTYGTPRRPAPALAESLLRQSRIVVHDAVESGLPGDRNTTQVVNPGETAAAQEKAGEMHERFAEWVWEDPQRAAAVPRVQPRFNAIVLAQLRRRRTPDAARAGARRSSPGHTSAPRSPGSSPSRRRAVPRGRRRQDRRDGHRRRWSCDGSAWSASPCIVVPNHMLEQFCREWLAAVPAGPAAGRAPRTPTSPATAPRVRAPRRHQRLGRRHHDPLGVRAHPGLREAAAGLHRALEVRASCRARVPTRAEGGTA